MQVNVMERILAGAAVVGEGDVVKVDAAVRDLRDGVGGIGEIGRLLQHLGDAVGARGGHGDHDEDHGEHHEAAEHLHDVGEEAREVAGRERALHDEVRAEPAEAQHAAVDREAHHRAEGDHDLLHADEEIREIRRGAGELVVLIFLAHKRFDDADGRDVLLHAGVQIVIALEHLAEHGDGLAHDEEEKQRQQRHEAEEDQREARVDHKAHDEAEDQHQRRAHRDAQEHHVGVLQVRHVRGHARDETRGGEFVDVREGERLHLLIHGLPDVLGKAGGRARAVAGREDAAHEREHGEQQHQSAVGEDVAQVSGLNAVVDDRGGDVGDEHLHRDLDDHKQGRENRVLLVLPHIPQQGADHGHGQPPSS